MNNLTSVIFKNEIRKDVGFNYGKKSGALSVLSFMIVFSALASFMTWISIYLTKRLDEINQPYAFINIMLLGNFLILFFESIFQIINVLYFSKDLKILLRMPIKPKEIIRSKLLKLITSEYQMELIMLAIPMIVYGIIYKVGIAFYLYAVGILLILPVIPISITACIVAIIMRFINTIKNKTKVMYIAIIISIIVLNSVLFLFDGQFSVKNLLTEQVLTTENGLANEIANGFKLIKPIMNSLQNYDTMYGLKSFTIYIIESILIYGFSIIIISPIYLKGSIGTVINSNKSKIKCDYELKLEDFKKQSYKKTYISKEMKLIKRSPIFFIQCILTPVIMSMLILGTAIIFAIMTSNIDAKLLYFVRLQANTSLIAGVYLAVSQVLYMLNFNSIIAISKEKRVVIITKYIPIKLSEQLKMKMVIGERINFLAGICMSTLYYIFTINIINGILIFVISVITNLITEKIKIFIDLKNPRIKWDNEYTMMKQNTNVMYELFYTLACILIFIMLGILIKNIKLYFIIVCVITFIINIKLEQYLKNNDNKLFEKIH